MRFLLTFIWSLLLSGVLSYILTSMGGGAFNMMHSLILAIILSVAAFILSEGVLKGDSEA